MSDPAAAPKLRARYTLPCGLRGAGQKSVRHDDANRIYNLVEGASAHATMTSHILPLLAPENICGEQQCLRFYFRRI